MPTGSENVDAAWVLVDEATTALAAYVQSLIDDINKTAAEGLTGPQTENVLTRLTNLTATLNAMGQNGQVPPAPAPAGVMPGPLR